MKGGDMKFSLPVLLLIATLLTSGCTNENKTVAVTPSATVTQTTNLPLSIIPTQTEKIIQDNIDDRNFLDAAEICYNNTPVLKDTRTVLDFTICMQHTPKPTGYCAKQFRSEILTYTTKDDDTTAGYQRATHNMHIARVRFTECLAGIH
jgi:hypothetical protein